VRLVVYDGAVRTPTPIFNEKVLCGLGREIASTGRLDEESIERALDALTRFKAITTILDVKHVRAIATAACRDAVNGHDFIVAGEKALGTAIHVLSGQQEAELAAKGILMGFRAPDGFAGDLGGGSLELTELDGDSAGHGISLPYGTLRLPELRAAGTAGFARKVRAGLRVARWSSGEGAPFYLVGGSWRALARYAMHRLDWPLDDPHGYELLPEQALQVCRAAARGKLAAADLPRIAAARLESLPDAAALLGALIREMKPSKLVFSSWGLREGLLYRKLDTATRARDPLLASLTGFVETYGVSTALAATTAGWTAKIGPASAGDDEKLRLAATMLSLAAMRSSPTCAPSRR
jgi:exopolyphosphatase/guanosine-5'-triphosphate,3'-diphosphate pyrophosphatase